MALRQDGAVDPGEDVLRAVDVPIPQEQEQRVSRQRRTDECRQPLVRDRHQEQRPQPVGEPQTDKYPGDPHEGEVVHRMEQPLREISLRIGVEPPSQEDCHEANYPADETE